MIGSTQKALLTFGCLIPVPVATVLLMLAASSEFDGSPSDVWQAVLFGLYWVLVAAMLGTLVVIVLHIRRRADLSPGTRKRWYWSAFFFNVFMLPVAWWKLIRPLNTA
jgi:hypothetical protein